MLANYLIGLREGLEAAVVVGILVVYLVRSRRRDLLPHVWAGVLSAIAVSLGVGAVLIFGGKDLPDAIEPAIAGGLSIAAVFLVTWMIFWMARTSRLLRRNLELSLDRAIGLGGSAVLVLALVAVGREGLETAVFLWASFRATGPGSAPLLGAILGLSTAVLLGWAITRGAVRLNLGVFFRVTGVVLVVIAAGVLAHGIHDLQEAGIFAGAHTLAFDVTEQIPPSSWYGSLLAGLLGFSPDATVLEVVAWFVYLVPVVSVFVVASRQTSLATPSAPSGLVPVGRAVSP